MNALSRTAAISLILAYAAALAPSLFSAGSYELQHRESPGSPPSRSFLLGTDELGRDRFSRLLYGARVSLLLAPAAALFATLLAASIGGLSCLMHGWFSRTVLAAVDVVVSVPWLFLMLTVRALLPLNVSPWASVAVTFSLLGLLGWAPAVRVFRAEALRIAESDYVTQAYVLGLRKSAILGSHVLPNLLPVVRGQFWSMIPVFVLAEANLSLLGLGVTEPLPSLGNLMSELQNYTAVAHQPWIAAPAILLAVVIAAMHCLHPKGEAGI